MGIFSYFIIADEDGEEESDDITAEVVKERSGKSTDNLQSSTKVRKVESSDDEQDEEGVDEETVRELYNALKGSVS